MKNTNKLVNILVPLASVLLAFLIGCIIMLALGANPLVALQNPVSYTHLCCLQYTHFGRIFNGWGGKTAKYPCGRSLSVVY